MQVVKSKIPFQEKSSTLPTPNAVSSSSSSMFSKSTGLPPAMIGASPPSAVPPVALRLNQMFGQAVKRCQATPIVAFRPSTIAHAIDTTILTIATSQITVCSSVSGAPA